MTQRWPFVFSGLLFVACIGAGFTQLRTYETTPGVAARPPASSPVTLAALSHQTRLPVLLMFVHPRCPCTRASLDELAILMAQETGRVSAHVVFALPDSNTRRWLPSDLWRQARAIPGVNVTADVGGVLTRRFGSVTSGQVLLYDSKGFLLFQGGITAARGHDGDNAGNQDILSLLHGDRHPAKPTPVFGCPLFAAASGQPGKDSSACRNTQSRT